MNKKTQQQMVIWVVVALVVGGILGYMFARSKYKPQISDLTTQVNQMKMKVDDLQKALMQPKPTAVPNGGTIMHK